jgi:hypothetical protein
VAGGNSHQEVSISGQDLVVALEARSPASRLGEVIAPQPEAWPRDGSLSRYLWRFRLPTNLQTVTAFTSLRLSTSSASTRAIPLAIESTGLSERNISARGLPLLTSSFRLLSLRTSAAPFAQ